MIFASATSNLVLTLAKNSSTAVAISPVASTTETSAEPPCADAVKTFDEQAESDRIKRKLRDILFGRATTRTEILKGGHWIHQEAFEDVNKVLLEWLQLHDRKSK